MLGGHQQEIFAERDGKLEAQNSGRIAASGPREERRSLVSGLPAGTDKVDYFRIADHQLRSKSVNMLYSLGWSCILI
jgi:hypothetical protein